MIYSTEKDKQVKRYLENLYSATKSRVEVRSNWIYNYEIEIEIERAINTLSRSKAVGVDGVPSTLLKQDKNSPILQKIERWFKSWLIEGNIPEYIMQGRWVLISKDKTECPALNDIRAISVLPAITKFFEAAIMHNFEKATYKQSYSKNQRGFTKGYSIIDNIRDILFLAKTLKENKTTNTPALIFFDFVKAYDSVPRDKLIDKLLAFEIPCNVVKLVNSMLNKFTLKAGNETIETHKGLIQGSVLSPIIFNLFINDLLINRISALKPIWSFRAWLGLQGSGSLIPRTNHGPTYNDSEIDEFWICLKSSIPIDLLEFGGWTQVSILLDFPFALCRNLDLEIKIVQMDYPSQDEKNHRY